MRKTEIAVPEADAVVQMVPLSGALPVIDASVSVVAVDDAPPGLTGWRLLDAMRTRFDEIRQRTEAVVELPVDPSVDGAHDVLALRPELGRLCGEATEGQVQAFVSACRQFDVVPVIPWRWRALAPTRRRCVLRVEDPQAPGEDPVIASWSLRVGSARDLAVTASVERIMECLNSGIERRPARSIRAHREWLDSLEVREPCG